MRVPIITKFHLGIGDASNDFHVNFDSSQVGVSTQELIVVVQQNRRIAYRRETNSWNSNLYEFKQYEISI